MRMSSDNMGKCWLCKRFDRAWCSDWNERMSKAPASRRPNIIVISSREAVDVARAIKQNFDSEADVDLWDEGVFPANRGYLDTLLDRASYYDFVIAAFTADDSAIIRKRQVRITRGNVIFEFGLFLGRLGLNRSFFVLEEGVELFSDWSGVVTASFKRRDNLIAAVGGACQKIRAEMGVAETEQRFTMLPSTALAIGYYQNFVRRFIKAFNSSIEYTVSENDHQGNALHTTTHKITKRGPILHVLLPGRLQDLEAERFRGHYKQIMVRTSGTNEFFRLYTRSKLNGSKSIVFFDVPATMLASKIAIERSFSDDFLARQNTAQHLEDREIANFERTLRLMVSNDVEKERFKLSVLR